MNALLAAVVLLLTCVGMSSAAGAGTPSDRPPGIAAADGVAVSSSLGLVLVHPAERPHGVGDPTALLVAPPVEGYFMVKRRSTWRRLIIVEPRHGPGASG